MSATNVKLGPVQEFQMDLSAVSDREAIPAEGARAAALEGAVPVLNSDWSYSATAEGQDGGEVSVNSIDMDGEEGIIYNGPSGVTVRVVIRNFDVDRAVISPGSGDTLAMGLFVNNTLVDYADGGFHGELEDETIEEFNVDAVIHNLQNLDVIRVGWVQGSENAELDLEVLNTGSLNIS